MLPCLNRLIFALALTTAGLVHAQSRGSAPFDGIGAGETATLERIRDAALQSDWGYSRLADLADLIGPRLAGSPGAAAAVSQLAAALESASIKVTLEPVTVPHWQRGLEHAELISYAGRPDGITQKIVLTALGSSTATPAAGINASVLVIRDFAELERRAAEVKGKIVLFNAPFDLDLAANGYSGQAYGSAGRYRFIGPARAAKLGAVAVLVRSIGSANFRLPHTGNTNFPPDVPAIPSAAVSTEDALLMERLSRRGAPVIMHLTLTPEQLPEVQSSNVIGEIPGTDANAGIVLISGHVDAWDLGTGAMDDGIGVISAMATLKIFQDLGLHPRRTIRFVGWMNEENGSRGAAAYIALHQAELAQHMAAVESDFGIGKPLGIVTNANVEVVPALQAMAEVLQPIGANVVQSLASDLGSDLSGLEAVGVPVYEPLVDARHYFDYHHTAADTLDKVNPDDFKKQVALMAVLIYFLADADPALPRAAMPFSQR